MLLTNLKLVTPMSLLVAFVCTGAGIFTHVLTAEPAREQKADNSTPTGQEKQQPKTEQPKKRAATDAKIQELLKERLATLKALATFTHRAYLAAKADFAEVARVNTLLVQAELELCESHKERLAVHEKAVGLAREYEKVATQLYKTGQATYAATLAATANRLEAEIEFERTKAKVAKQAK